MPEAVDDAESERLAQVRRLVVGYREAAHRALAFARRYREEEGTPGGDRERACIAQAREWRRAAHDVRAGRPVEVTGPGLARTRPDVAAQQPASKRAG